ncbi:YitT family protein [Kitasatospora sp. NPDC087314]|uniref:YczE/YyaS/YitT family protein n=1 Tax=Kitasatospora sp. NPDC087314 TaxID=3364068 RepID=UPI00382A9AD4
MSTHHPLGVDPNGNPRRLGELLPRALVYLAGCLVFSTGAHFFIQSDLGTDPLDVFSLGVLRHLPLTIGICQAAVAVVCIAAWAAWNRKRPVVSPFVTFFLCGSLIDLFQWLRPAAWLGLRSYPLMLLGALLCAYASALIIMSGFGIRAIDLLAITIRHRRTWPFWCAKGLIEGVLLLCGWLLGGPVGIGTVAFLVFVDLLIEPFVRFNRRFLDIPDHGFAVALAAP